MSARRSSPLIGAVFSLAACAGHTPSPDRSGGVASSPEGGTLPAGHALSIDAGVSYLRLTMEERDSVAWSLETKPQGCATARATPGRLEIDGRDQHCATRWDVRVPIIEDVRARVSVGDIDVSAPIDRAIRIHSGVGSVRFRLDGRELRGGKTPGSGDEFKYGDLDTQPRLDVSTGVGWVHAETRTKR